MKNFNRFMSVIAIAVIAMIVSFSFASCGSDDDDPKASIRITKFDVSGQSSEVNTIQRVFKDCGVEYNRTYSGNTVAEISTTLKKKCTDAMLELTKSQYSFSSQHAITIEGRTNEDASVVIYTGTLNANNLQ